MLNKPGPIYKHNITGELHTAVQTSNAQHHAVDISARLDVRLTNPSSQDERGWDLFALDYTVNKPINAVFTSMSRNETENEQFRKAARIENVFVKETYNEIFRFLWNLKRVEYTLTNTWREQMTTAQCLSDFREVRIACVLPSLTLRQVAPTLHQCSLLRAEMQHFLTNLQHYVMFEVLECSWDELARDIKCATDFDQVIAAHDKYLSSIMQKALLKRSRANDEIQSQIRGIADLIFKFAMLQGELHTLALEVQGNKKERMQRVNTRTQQGGWGITDADDDSHDITRVRNEAAKMTKQV